MTFKPRQGFFEHVALLAEGKAHQVVRLSVLVEHAERDQRHARLAHQPFAEHPVRFVRQAADVGSEKVRAFAGERLEAEPRNARREQIALGLELDASAPA